MPDVSKISIARFSTLCEPDAGRFLKEVKQIFFQTSVKKVFQTPLQKSAYYHTWLGYYLDFYPGFALIAVWGKRCVGYIVGVPDSSTQGHLFDRNPAYEIFCDLYEKYPSHLHINCHPDFQGKGIGTLLVNSFCHILQDQSICGVHIVTAQTAANVEFYEKMNFSFKKIRQYQDRNLLFMAKSL